MTLIQLYDLQQLSNNRLTDAQLAAIWDYARKEIEKEVKK